MVALIVYYIHLIAFSAGFTKRYQEANFGEGILTVAFMGLIFVVGWSIWAFLLKFAVPPEGFGKALDRDAFTLLVLTISEAGFYYFFVRK